MLKKITLMVITIFALIRPVSAVQAPAIVIFDSPVKQATNVALNSGITISTNYNIIQSSVKNFVAGPDTNVAYAIPRNTFLLIPKFIADIKPDSLYKFLRLKGTVSINDANTLTFQPLSALAAGVEYKLIISGLKVVRINPADTVTIPDTSITFTTVPAAHKLIGLAPFNINIVRCNDTIVATYNRNINNITTSLGDIISLNRLDSTKTINNQTVRYTSPVTVTKWIDSQNSSIVRIKPTANFEPGIEYILKTRTSFLSGDSTDDEDKIIRARDNYRVTMSVGVTDTVNLTPPTDVLFPFEGDNYFAYNQTVSVSAKQETTDLIFVRWESNDPQINGLQKNRFELSYDCQSMRDIYVKAIYSNKRTVTCNIAMQSPLTCYVYNSQHQLLGSAGVYQIPQGDKLFVEAIGTTASKFDYWQSSEQDLNGTPGMSFNKGGKGDRVQFIQTSGANAGNSAFIQVMNNGRDISVNGNPTTNDSEYGLKFSSYFGEYDEARQLRNLPATCGYVRTKVNGQTITTGEYSSGNNSENVSLTFEITENAPRCASGASSFGILGVWGVGVNQSFDPPYPESVTFDNVSTKSAYAPLTVYVVPKIVSECTLTVEAAWGTHNTGVIGKDVTVKAEILEGNTVVETEVIREGQTSILLQDLHCSQQVRLTAINDPAYGFSLNKWLDTDPNYSYPSPNNLHEWTITVTGQNKVRAIFDEGFRLEEVGLYLDNDRNSNVTVTTPTFIKINDVLKNDKFFKPNVQVFNAYTNQDDGYGTKILFKFNQPISKNDFIGKIIVHDLSVRADDHVNLTDIIPATQYTLRSDNCEIDPNYPGGNVLAFYVKNTDVVPNYSIPKGEQFDLYFSSAITNSLNNKPLATPNVLKTFETEIPGIALTVTKYYIDENSGDWWDNEVELLCPWAYSIFSLNETNTQFNEVASDDGQIPNTTSWTLKSPGEVYTPNVKILETNQMFGTDMVNVILGALDDDWDVPDDWSDDFHNQLNEKGNNIEASHWAVLNDYDDKENGLLVGIGVVLDIILLIALFWWLGPAALEAYAWVQAHVEVFYGLGMAAIALIDWMLSTFDTDSMNVKSFTVQWKKNMFGNKKKLDVSTHNWDEIEYEVKLKKLEESNSTNYY